MAEISDFNFFAEIGVAGELDAGRVPGPVHPPGVGF
jgi:hypothetical protein